MMQKVIGDMIIGNTWAIIKEDQHPIENLSLILQRD